METPGVLVVGGILDSETTIHTEKIHKFFNGGPERRFVDFVDDGAPAVVNDSQCVFLRVVIVC